MISPDKLRSRKALLLAVALAGFFGFNGVFLYYALLEPSVLAGALANPVAAAFVAEAIALTLLGAWLVHEAGLRRPGCIAFALLSLAGGLVFSVPAFTLWRLRKEEADKAKISRA